MTKEGGGKTFLNNAEGPWSVLHTCLIYTNKKIRSLQEHNTPKRCQETDDPSRILQRVLNIKLKEYYMKKLAILGALVLVVAMASAAYAEVQNVKVGGDIRTAYRLRNNYDLDRGNIDTPNINNIQGDTDQWIETRARIYVQADLTDNVRAMIRIIADFVWGIDVASNNANTSNLGAAGGEDYNVEIDLAWVELIEFWFS
ncbi:hypothetical protein IIB34_02960, partial [PVC group bacterium]|nr:hypothetical protein [PVC group bacterium]